MKVRLAPGVERDLIAILDWIASDDPERARAFVAELRERALSLGRRPLAYPVVARRGETTLRKCSHRGYVILYRVNDAVVILRVVHAARDYLSDR